MNSSQVEAKEDQQGISLFPELTRDLIEKILLGSLKENEEESTCAKLEDLQRLSLVTKNATIALSKERAVIVADSISKLNDYMVLKYFNNFIDKKRKPFRRIDDSVLKRFQLYLYDYEKHEFLFKELEVTKLHLKDDTAKANCKEEFKKLLENCCVIIAYAENDAGDDFAYDIFYDYKPQLNKDSEADIFNVIQMYTRIFGDYINKKQLDNTTQIYVENYYLYLITFIVRMCSDAIAVKIAQKVKNNYFEWGKQLPWNEIFANQLWKEKLVKFQNFLIQQGLNYQSPVLNSSSLQYKKEYGLPHYTRYIDLFFTKINPANNGKGDGKIDTSYIGKNECRTFPQTMRKTGGAKKTKTSTSNQYIKTKAKYSDKSGKQYVIYKKGDKSYIKKKSMKTGKFTYRGISL